MDSRRDSDLWDSPDESFFNSPMTPPANQEPEESKTHLKRNNVMRNLHKALMILLAASLLPLASTSVNAAAPTVITLTQTGCQFTEPEGRDHGFKTAGGGRLQGHQRPKREKAPRRIQYHHAQTGPLHLPGNEQERALSTRVLSARRRRRTPHAAEGLGGRPREGEVEGLPHHPQSGRLLLFMPPETRRPTTG